MVDSLAVEPQNKAVKANNTEKYNTGDYKNMEPKIEFNPAESKIIEVDIEKEMKKSFLDYSMSVIVSRALPDVRDGLKPVHRRILYTMFEHGLFPDRDYHKCADTVGNVLGSYHPHGDSSVYDALVRMAQDFSLRYPLVDGHGNFGSVDGDPPAAYRYTEARMSKISMEMLSDIGKDTVEFGPNYDDRLKEPTVLPSKFPNLIINGSSGIAVGMATNIPPHNLNEVIDAICFLIDNEDAEINDIMRFIKGPDFPTGGIIMGHAGIKAAYATGRGKITLRSKAEIEEYKEGRFRIIVSELPYQVNKARLVENIAEHIKNKKIEGIKVPRDESGRDGMRIVIEIKKGHNPSVILNKLYSYTQMQDTFGIINLALVDGVPKILTIKDMLSNYIGFQKEVVINRTKYDLNKANLRAHILTGLKIALDYIDRVIETIKNSKDVTEAKSELMRNFGLDEVQSEAIVKMRLGQLSGLERQKTEDELSELEAKIKEYNLILHSDERVKEIIKEELSAIKKKYGDDRRTQIEAVSGEVDVEDLIPVEDCVITFTRFGYIKRQPVDVYKTQKRGGRGKSGLKRRDEDFVEKLFIASSHDYLMFITNQGAMYRLKCFEVPAGGRSSKGTNIINLINLKEGEKVQDIICTKDFYDDKHLFFVTKRGLGKKTNLSEYKNCRQCGIRAISLMPGDELVDTKLTDAGDLLIIATKEGKAIKINENNVTAVGRNARGVKAVRLKGDDCVIGMEREKDGEFILTATSKGKGRRSRMDLYREQARGGIGLINYKTDDKNGFVIGIKAVNEDDDVILISKSGVIIRINVNEIPSINRSGTGVRVMRTDEHDEVVNLARIEPDDEKDDGQTIENEEE